jgi:hypothetical protein
MYHIKNKTPTTNPTHQIDIYINHTKLQIHKHQPQNITNIPLKDYTNIPLKDYTNIEHHIKEAHTKLLSLY